MKLAAKLMVAGFLLAFFGEALAQAQGKMNVMMQMDADDMVGSRLAFALKERVRQSSGFALVTSNDDAIFKIAMVTIDPNASTSPGNSTVYSVVFAAWQPQSNTWTYMNNVVGVCGAARLTECADGIVAKADQTADISRQFYRTYFKK
jgi:hypothetical protein